MRRLLALSFISVCALAVACDGDGDGGTTSPTPGAATATAASEPSPTPRAQAGIVIEAPTDDQTVQVPFHVSGTANVFEGALTIDLLGAGDAVVCKRHVQAASGSGTPGPWDGILAFPPPPSELSMIVRAYTFSAMDGSVQDLVERDIRVSGEHPNIVIESPGCAEEVNSGPLVVSGMAQVFEAVLFVDVRDSSGTPLIMQRVMAASGTEYAPWSTTLDLSGIQTGLYDLVAYTHSARDGSIIDEFPMQIVVR